MANIAAVTKRVNEMDNELGELLAEAENLIAPEKRAEFATHIELMFLNSNVQLIEMCSKMADMTGVDQSDEVVKKWHELRAKSEVLRRRNELLSHSTPEEFQATLMWMAEQGTADDLSLIRQIRTWRADGTENLNRLFDIAEQRICQRVSGVS